MRTQYFRPHHQLIQKALEYFNTDYLTQNNILFGGGTRIALEINEYRQSIDIDFFCPDKSSFRAVRQQVTSKSLGNLVVKDFDYVREIRSDRDAVRTFIQIDQQAIKLEFISFADYQLTTDIQLPFCVPSISHSSCFFTKLLANADRYNDAPFKDIFDILAMVDSWGDIPEEALHEAYSHYGKNVVLNALLLAIDQTILQEDKRIAMAIESLSVSLEYAQKLITKVAPSLKTTVLSLK